MLAVFCIAALALFKPVNNQLNESKVRASIEKKIHALSVQSSVFFNASGDSIIQSDDSWKFILNNKLVQKGWELYLFELDELVSWSSNDFEADTSLIRLEGHQLINNKFGWNLVSTKRNETSTLVAVYPLFRKGTALVQEINRLPELTLLEYDMDRGSTTTVVPVDSLQIIKNEVKLLESWQFYLVILFIICIVPLYLRSLQIHNWWVLFYPLVFLIIRVALYRSWFLPNLNDYEFFNPGVYASSFLLPSLGDLFLHSLVALTIALSLRNVLKKSSVKIKGLFLKSLQLFSLLVSVFLADLQYGLVEGLVLDSNISYDILNLQTINEYSIVAIFLIALNACTWLILSRSLFRFSKIDHSSTSWLVLISVLAVALFYTFQHYDASRSFGSLYQGILIFLFLVFWLYKVEKYKWKNFLFLIFLLSILSSISIRSFDSMRDLEHLKFHASKLVTEKDLNAEYQFEDIETKLVSEFLNPSNFRKLNLHKDDFEKRLRHLYFSSSLSQYELKLLSFNSENNSIDTFTLFDYEFLEDLYNDAYPTISKYFYQIKKPSETNGYIAKFENCDENGHYGNVYLLLEPKVIQSTHVYTPLLQKKSRRDFFSLSDYSYAIYDKGKLLKQKGDVAYELRYDEKKLGSSSLIWGSYSHYISNQSEDVIVVMSTRNSSGLKLVSTISFSFLFYCIAILFGLILFMLAKMGLPYMVLRTSKSRLRIENELTQLLNTLGLGRKLLSVRIQLIMGGLIFAGLLASVFFTIVYLEVNHNQRSREDLSLKINEVVNQLQNEPNLGKKLEGQESVTLLTAEVSDIHKVEANIFDVHGVLLASSKPEIYTKALFSRMMNPIAFYEMNVEQVSQLIHKESLRGFEYLTAYVPLFNEKHEIIGYINLPYFIGQSKLNEEISTYTITFVNLYLLLFALALALAYFVSKRITRPLKIIQEKISTTALGSKNETIEWKGSDEIGQLIKQYNKMVLELESSADKLSASEREGAWKEMARQVAHEIKNPLTPMKLNIQHLQRAWKDEHPKLEDTFKKVTRVLVDQIESLSKLASEFSSFAQMPIDDFNDYDIHQLLLDTILLFERSEDTKFIYDKSHVQHNVFGDKEQIRRALNNLIKNAVQAIPADASGIIVIETTVEDNYFVISINDNGSGIDNEIGEKIFVPRFSTKTSGMGLGLAITKKIIENNGGTISFESREGTGTTFTMRIPLKNDNGA
jgi:two-component system, NtrC family, nitrogen regulation sensor histidine kinase NtrY